MLILKNICLNRFYSLHSDLEVRDIKYSSNLIPFFKSLFRDVDIEKYIPFPNQRINHRKTKNISPPTSKNEILTTYTPHFTQTTYNIYTYNTYQICRIN